MMMYYSVLQRAQADEWWPVAAEMRTWTRALWILRSGTKATLLVTLEDN